MRQIIFSSLVLLVLGSLTYRWYTHRFPTWTEEVLLSDGRVITVKQKLDYIEGYGTRETSLTFSLPEMDGKQTWNEHLMPSIIGVDNGHVYVIGMPRGTKQYESYLRPRWFLVAFTWEESIFKRIPLSEVPVSVRKKENVLRCPPQERGFISWQRKIAKWCESATDIGSSRRELDYEALELLSQDFARMTGHTPFSE